MTKKHFELVARVIREARERSASQWDNPDDAKRDGLVDEPFRAMAKIFADEFTRENPRFDRERFLKACGLDA